MSAAINGIGDYGLVFLDKNPWFYEIGMVGCMSQMEKIEINDR